MSTTMHVARARRGRIASPARHAGCAAILLWILALSVGGASDVLGADRDAFGGYVAAGASLRLRDALYVREVGPRVYGEPAAWLEAGIISKGSWSVNVTGDFGGAWYTFGTEGARGRVDRVGWGVRLGVDKFGRWGERLYATSGIGVEYWETRSWLDNVLIYEEGPHGFHTGGSVRVAVGAMIAPRLGLEGRGAFCAYRGNARDGESKSEFRWLGQSTVFSAGLRWFAW